MALKVGELVATMGLDQKQFDAGLDTSKSKATREVTVINAALKKIKVDIDTKPLEAKLASAKSKVRISAAEFNKTLSNIRLGLDTKYFERKLLTAAQNARLTAAIMNGNKPHDTGKRTAADVEYDDYVAKFYRTGKYADPTPPRPRPPDPVILPPTRPERKGLRGFDPNALDPSNLNVLRAAMKSVSKDAVVMRAALMNAIPGSPLAAAYAAKLGVMEARLASVGAVAKDTETRMFAFGNKLKEAGTTLSGVGRQMLTSVTLPIMAAVGGAFAMAHSVGQAARQIQNLAASTGLTTDQLQQLQYISGIVGVNFSTLTREIMRLPSHLMGVGKETSTTGRALKMLGIDAEISKNHLKPMSQLLPEIITKLQGIPDVSTRMAVASKVFGGVGSTMRDLAPILALSADEFKRLGEEAVASGNVLSGPQLIAAIKFDEQFRALTLTMKGLGNQLGIALQKPLSQLMPFIQKTVIPTLVEWFKKGVKIIEWLQTLSPEVKKNVFFIVGLAAAMGPLLMFFGPLLKGIGGLIAGFKTMKLWTGVVITALQNLTGAEIAVGATPILLALGAVALAIWAIKNRADEAAGAIAQMHRGAADAVAAARDFQKSGFETSEMTAKRLGYKTLGQKHSLFYQATHSSTWDKYADEVDVDSLSKANKARIQRARIAHNAAAILAGKTPMKYPTAPGAPAAPTTSGIDLTKLDYSAFDKAAKKGAGGRSAKAELTDAQKATESLRSKILDLSRAIRLQGDSSEYAALKDSILFGEYKKAPALVQAQALKLADLDAWWEKEREASDAARSSQIGYLKSLAETGKDTSMQVFLDTFSKYLPKNLAGVTSLKQLRDVYAKLPAPIKAAIDAMSDWIEKTEKGRETAQAMADAAEKLQQQMTELASRVTGAKMELFKAQLGAAGRTEDLRMLEMFGDLAGDISLPTITVADTLALIRFHLRQLGPDAESLAKIGLEAQGATAALTAAAEAAKKLTDENLRKAERQQDAEQSLQDILDQQEVARRKLAGLWSAEDEIWSQLPKDIEKTADVIAKVGEAAQRATKLEAWQQFQDKIQAIADQMQGIFSNAFEKLMTDGFGSFFKNVIEGFKQMINKMVADFLASQLMAMLTRNLPRSGGGGGDQPWSENTGVPGWSQLIGAFAGSGGGGGGGSWLPGMPDIFKASGGPVSARTPYLIGERGPELFVPSSAGKIIPNAELAGTGQNNYFSFSYQISTPNPEAFRQSQSQLIDQAYRAGALAVRRNG